MISNNRNKTVTKYKHIIYCYCLFLGLAVMSMDLMAAIPPGKWQCMAIDRQDNTYSAIGDSREHAMANAVTVCRGNSKGSASSCKSAQSFCEQGPLGIHSRECVVSDNAGRNWSASGVDACKTALYMCNNWQNMHGSSRSGQCTVTHR